MSEIEQLRADIEKLENAMPIATRLGAQATCSTLRALKSEIEFELAKLEAKEAAKADPWAEEKRLVKVNLEAWVEGSVNHRMASFSTYLQQRVAELEAELAKRPVAWCARRKDSGGYYQYLDGPRLFPSLEDAKRLFGDSDPKWVIEPYTGEQT